MTKSKELDDEHILSITVMFVILMLTVAGNFLTILVTIKKRNFQKVRHYMITNLALSDVLIALVAIPFRLIQLFGSPWNEQKQNCLISISITIFFCNCSVLNLTLLSYDRYKSIIKPFSYEQIPRVNNFWRPVLINWVIAAFISLLPFMGWRRHLHDIHGAHEVALCRYLAVLDIHYVIFVFVTAVFAPFFVMVGVYIRIYCVSRVQVGKICHSIVLGTYNNAFIHENTNNEVQQNEQQRSKQARFGASPRVFKALSNKGRSS